EGVREGEGATPGTGIGGAALREAVEAAGEARDDRVLERADAPEVEARRRELDAVLRESLRFDDDLGEVQERLRRDAADVQAHAAEALVALDERHAEPEVGRAERRGVAARPGAEHRDVDAQVRVAHSARFRMSASTAR